MPCCCCCSIIPNDVLLRLANDPRLTPTQRQRLLDTAKIDKEVRKLRIQALRLTRVAAAVAPMGAIAAAAPSVNMYNCNHSTTLPGAPVANPGASADVSVKQCFDDTKAVAAFYKQVFGRNSIDNAGMAIISSVHYGVDYGNAQWQGAQMFYGDGDGQTFVDFTNSNDIIAHELTHGVTQHTLRLAYSNEAGGLNESMSDVFGSMFRQWQAGETAATADWLIGSDLIGPLPKANGVTCLRNMASPGAANSLQPQPFHYTPAIGSMDPHYSSGIPNFAFYQAATTIGGQTWATLGQVWYAAMTAGASPNMKMSAFANRTRQAATNLFPANPAIFNAVDTAWTNVGL